MSLNVVILAAGKGTRMHSELPKVIHSLANKPLLQHVLETSQRLNPETTTIITGYKTDLVKKSITNHNISWCLQEKQLGTGHAVLQSTSHLSADKTLILYGDVPLIDALDLQQLLNKVDEGLAILTCNKTKPEGYGRIVRHKEEIIKIVEEKDCNKEEKKITEINTGIIACNTKNLIAWLGQITNNNSQNEYYLTDIVEFAVKDGLPVHSQLAQKEISVFGVNSKEDLAEIERELQMSKAKLLMSQGVTLLDPSRIDIRGELKCGTDVTIDVGCIFEGSVTLGANVHLKPYCVLKDCEIKDGTIVEAYSHIDSSIVGSSSRIGPYARLRPGTSLANNVHIGNFVEIKNSSVNQGSKINHLSYIGDSEIGKNVNIGAGTITCNYDGVKKHKTIIEDNVFIGSSSQLIAPVIVGKGATIGAGSTITKNAPEDQLTLSRSQQKTIFGWHKPEKK